MDVKEYCNQTAILEQIKVDADGKIVKDKFSTISYDTPETIAVRIEGGTHLIRQADSSIYESHRTYWVLKKFRLKSKINGQVVMGTTEYYDIDGTFQYLEAYV